MKHLHHWIDGKPREGSSERYGAVTDPATGHQEKQVPFASVEEVDAAVQAAKDAYVTWGRTSLAKRTSILFRFRALLEANRDAIA
ncbi:aldehyde dehydrogenase family protein, partial [Streptomyces cylindrosporus]